MVVNYKLMRRMRNRKRNNSAAPIRLPRHRRPETLQRFWRARLQPWIDFANLLPFERLGIGWWRTVADLDREGSESLCRSFVHRFATRREPSALNSLAWRVTRFQTREPQPSAELDALFKTVRNVFEHLHSMTWPSETEWLGRSEHYDSVPLAIPYFIEDTGNGRVSFKSDPLLEAFKKALEDTEISRVRRCGLCGKFYYATRANKGACEEHLARARVERSRDSALRQKYEETRRVNQLSKQGMPVGKAIAKVKGSKKRRPAEGS